MKNINQITKEFIVNVLETPEFTELSEASNQLSSNKEAKTIIENVEEKKRTIMTLQQSGLPFTDKQQQDLQDEFTKMRANEICMRIIKAQNGAIKLAQKITKQLSQETGIPFTSGSCCG